MEVLNMHVGERGESWDDGVESQLKGHEEKHTVASHSLKA